MPLDVTLADLAWRWQMKDDGAVTDWLSRRPWLDGGGVFVVQAPDDEIATPTALHGAIYSADQRTSEVRPVDLIAEGSSFVEVVSRWLNTSHKKSRDCALALSEDLAVRPAVFILDARSAPTTNWVDEAFAFWDLAAKLEARPLTCVILHLRGHAPIRGSHALDRGWPVGLARAVIGQESEAREVLWPRYVHLRCAWESGGIVDDALDCSALAANLAPGDDDGLEVVLNTFATEKFTLMPEAEQVAWTHLVSGARDGTSVPSVFGADEVADARLTPFPWLARALLVRRAARENQLRVLRSEINCRPISEQILNVCFAAETHLRGRLTGMLPRVPADIQVLFERFAARGRLGPSLEAELYPDAHPSPPADAWDFVSLGLVIGRLVDQGSGNWDQLGLVRVLRNAAAHGHYMGWRSVREARTIRNLISR